MEFVSDTSVLIRFPGEPSVLLTHKVLSAFHQLRQATVSAPIVNFHPAYDSILVDFDFPKAALAKSPLGVLSELERCLLEPPQPSEVSPRLIQIPVRYGGELGPDLSEVAQWSHLSPEEVIATHAAPLYTVAFLGFAPGFPYLLGLPETLHIPRKSTPRLRIPAGSVAVAAGQTGIYPEESPAGWQWIGHTDEKMFDPLREPASLLSPGDQVQFLPSRSVPASGRQSEVREKELLDKAVFRIETPGFFTTVQDLGRFGYAHWGVSAGGAADPLAIRLGNRLLGNQAAAAAIEMTVTGATFTFLADTWIVLTGAPCEAELDQMRLMMATSIPVCAGQRLSVGRISEGLRSYLCIYGGVGSPQVLGSRSTFVSGGWGGHLGRALRQGDCLSAASQFSQPPRFRRASNFWNESYSSRTILRVTPGPQVHWFGDEAFHDFLEGHFLVTDDVSRKGLRLQCEASKKIMRRSEFSNSELVSEGIPNGAIQIMPTGNPILLFCEQQTTGGYPKLATIIKADWHLLGQLKPGDNVSFLFCTFEDAWRSALTLETNLKAAVLEV